MTRQEIEHMWKVARDDPNFDTNWYDPVIVAFAKLVAQHEREACAKVCDDIRHYNLSQETDDWIEGTKDCANAIRARGQV